MTLYVSNRDGNGKTNEEGHYKFQTSMVKGNVLGSSSLQVVQNTTPGMSVIVNAGQFKVDTSNDYAYTGWSTVTNVVSVSTSDPSNPRITSIVLYVDKSAATSASPPNNPDIAKYMSINGIPAASPSAPGSSVIQSAIGSGNPYIVLANIYIQAASTTILNANITDMRVKTYFADSLVATTSIVDKAVTNAKIADSTITGSKISSNTITSDNLAKGAVISSKLSNPYIFSVARNASATFNNVPILYDVKNFDPNNNYSTATGRYTAPISGYYQLNVISSQLVSAAPQDPVTTLRKNGGEIVSYAHIVNMYNGASAGSANLSVLLRLNAGDYVEVIGGSRPLEAGTSRNVFSGFLVSAI